ncbi:hypothetical protein HHL11_30025 [Ramlibacter sp. G-1-2-2]|uniref:Uncharacterized protein n=1 Tax=Ramlibacter agri TaxID=2728837 RepID=A0A848HC23_9BURK|nr:hypothetical protein [Ramlibacter agri]NML48024.1 hypothetical protein [Ramlibacter agri]
MEDKPSNQGPSADEERGIGKTAAKRRDQLRQLEEKRRKTLARLNEARAQLAQAVAEDEARARRRQRNQQMQEYKRLKFVLGGLVLTVMQSDGPAAFAMSSQDLFRLSDKDRQLLDRVWAVIRSRSESGDSPCDATAHLPDVDLGLQK